jgi:WD40 repeat protein
MTRGTNYFLKTFKVSMQAPRETVLRGPVEERASFAALSPDGKELALAWGNGTITFCDAKTGMVLATTPQVFASNIFQIVFSPNGRLLAAAGREIEAGRASTAKILDAVTHKIVAVLAGHTDVVLSVGFSPDGRILATCGADDSIKLWETTTWKEIPPALRQKDVVVSLAFSPKGKRIASSSSDGTMRIWNVETRRELASLKLESATQYITFSPNGQTLAAYGWDHTLRLWRAPVPPENE